ncbi:hypothetical protein BG003_003673 [Podila horticola]|nr:hypothetical protein BG003_003673 [Podila horticola]
MFISVAGTLDAPIIIPAKLAISCKYLGHIVYVVDQDFARSWPRALIFATVAADQLPSWTNCAMGPTAITATSFSVSPYPSASA